MIAGLDALEDVEPGRAHQRGRAPRRRIDHRAPPCSATSASSIRSARRSRSAGAARAQRTSPTSTTATICPPKQPLGLVDDARAEGLDGYVHHPFEGFTRLLIQLPPAVEVVAGTQGAPGGPRHPRPAAPSSAGAGWSTPRPRDGQTCGSPPSRDPSTGAGVADDRRRHARQRPRRCSTRSATCSCATRRAPSTPGGGGAPAYDRRAGRAARIADPRPARRRHRLRRRGLRPGAERVPPPRQPRRLPEGIEHVNGELVVDGGRHTVARSPPPRARLARKPVPGAEQPRQRGGVHRVGRNGKPGRASPPAPAGDTCSGCFLTASGCVLLLEVERAGEADDRVHERTFAVPIAVDAVDERAIDLQDVDREPAEGGAARSSRSQVIECDAPPPAPSRPAIDAVVSPSSSSAVSVSSSTRS